MNLKEFALYWVRECIAIILILALSIASTFGQRALPIINATLTNIKIKDGYTIREGIWSLSPEVKPDIYYALRPSADHDIIFYTDIDSIAFHARPGNTYDFIVLLNGKDSCFTQISTKSPNNTIVDREIIMISPELLAMDFIVFRDYLQHEHPGLYRYKSEARMKMLFDSCLLSINKPETKLEFSKKILFLISEIQDGHTGTNISSLLVNTYIKSAKLFPIYLYFVGEKAFVSCDISKKLPPGTEVISINNVPIEDIKNGLLKFLPSDGMIETKKMQTLNNNGAFPFLYYWIYGPSDSFSVTFMNDIDKVDVATIQAQRPADFECDISNKYASGKNLDLKYVNERVALLSIKTFDKSKLGGRDGYFGEFIRKSFLEIKQKNISSLIIDVRDNAGGQDGYGSELYAYLTNKPFKYYTSVQSTEKVFKEQENSLLGLISPKSNHFPGKIIILINGLSFSTTSDFCAVARSNERAIFVGEETGGAYYGNTSGQTLKVELPNSKINVIIPKFKYVMDVKKSRYPDRGIIPDYPVVQNIHQYVNGIDIQLQFALDLIDNSAK